MLQKYKAKREEGFTIIEVLIVLAIAGLIILIVFLAVPALQRNSRNTQRHDDASKVAIAFKECLNNNNNRLTSCDSQLEMSNYIEVSENLQLVNIGGSPTTDTFAFVTNEKCDEAGTGTEPAVGSKSFAILYQVETSMSSADRCLDGN